MEQSQIASLGATRINVGLSAIIKMGGEPYSYQQQFKIIAGSATLEIVQCPVALTGASAAGWGTGYPLGATEIVSMNGPAVYYFAASGATMTVAILKGYTNGATVI